MKREITIHICDSCGKEMPMTNGGYYTVPDDEYAFVGVKAMFSNAGVGSKYDLCPRCTAEIVEQWLKAMKKEGERK